MVRMAFSSVAIASDRSADWLSRKVLRSRAPSSSPSAARLTGPIRSISLPSRETSDCSHDGFGGESSAPPGRERRLVGVGVGQRLAHLLGHEAGGLLGQLDFDRRLAQWLEFALVAQSPLVEFAQAPADRIGGVAGLGERALGGGARLEVLLQLVRRG